MPDQQFVLVETFASEQQGRTLWFQQMTPIGPMATTNADERAVFASEEAARRCLDTAALWHALTFYEIQPA